jgi:L,D-transpeptidase YcfS
MRNNDVVELAILVEEFAKIKNLNKVKVVLI